MGVINMNLLYLKERLCHLLKAKYAPHIAIVIIGIIICANIFDFVGTSLGGNYDWLMLPAKYFGMPNELAEYYNNQTLYNYNDGVGWDGQFYYYISNDILGYKLCMVSSKLIEKPEKMNCIGNGWKMNRL